MNGVRNFAATIALAGLVALAAKPCVISAHEIVPAQKALEIEGLTVDLLRCERANQATKCYLRITDAKQGDYCQLMADSARAFDFAGNEYIAKETQIGSQTGRGPGISLVRGIPTSASVTFRDMESAKDLVVLEIKAGGRGCAGRIFQFRDVAIVLKR